MALTPEDMAEIKAQLAQRMGPKSALGDGEMVPGAEPVAPPAELGALGQSEGGGGMGFGGINAAKQQAPQEPAFDPNAGFKFDPAAGSGGSALGGLASGLSGAMGMAKALRKGGKEPFGGLKDLLSSEQVPETTPLPE